MSWKVVDNIFTSEELDKLCDYFSTHGELSKGVTPSNTGKWRICDTCDYSRDTEDLKWFFKKLDSAILKINREVFNFKLIGYYNIMYFIYNDFENGQYKFHPDTAEGRLGVRKLSLSLILNEPGTDFEGGDFLFNLGNESKPHKASLKRGSMVLFPSYMLHAVSPVTKGTRKSVVVWVEGPEFV
jgi:PKHD-type hydroxylase